MTYSGGSIVVEFVPAFPETILTGTNPGPTKGAETVSSGIPAGLPISSLTLNGRDILSGLDYVTSTGSNGVMLPLSLSADGSEPDAKQGRPAAVCK